MHLVRRSRKITECLGLPTKLKRRFGRKAPLPIRSDFFESWTQENAYIIGYAFADATVEKNLKDLIFDCHCTDHSLIKHVKTVMKSGYAIAYKKQKNTCGCVTKIHNHVIIEDIVGKGCFPQKAKKLQFPKDLPPALLQRFALGNFDGDGSICMGANGEIVLGFTGHHDFIDDLKRQIDSAIGIAPPGKFGRNYAQYRNETALKVSEWLYACDPSFCLERKHKRFQQAKSIIHLPKTQRLLKWEEFVMNEDYIQHCRCANEECHWFGKIVICPFSHNSKWRTVFMKHYGHEFVRDKKTLV